MDVRIPRSGTLNAWVAERQLRFRLTLEAKDASHQFWDD